jgi:hypothetical protein
MFLKICICGNNIPDNEAIFRYLIKNLEFNYCQVEIILIFLLFRLKKTKLIKINF